MKKTPEIPQEDELHPEYDIKKLKGGVRGKYAKNFAPGSVFILLAPDVAEHFPDTQSVNDALRSLVEIKQGPTQA